MSDLVFDEWRTGELTPDRERAALAHVATCSRCQARQQTLVTHAQRFLARHPWTPTKIADRDVRAGRSASRRRAPRAWAWAATAGLTAAGFALVFTATPSTHEAGLEVGTRVKGASHIGFFVRRGDTVFRGSDRQDVRAGDRLRFVVTTVKPQHLAILSRDRAGTASVYYPTSAMSHALDHVQEAPLDAAVELDGVGGDESVVAVFCDAPFEVEPLRRALETTGALPHMQACTVDRLTLLKQAER